MNHENISPRDLPGFRKKSFSMFYENSEIWFEHLDGIYDHEDLVLEKLSQDILSFSRPTCTSLLCFNLDETVITNRIISAIINALIFNDKHFSRICFVGVNKKAAKVLNKSLSGNGFIIAFEDDFEKAKKWLVSKVMP